MLDGIYGLLATACGYTIEQIDRMTMSDFEMLSRYWADHPPTHLMVAGYLGIKPRKRTDETDLAKLLSGMSGWSRRMH